ncbi:MAG: TolC family protein [Planctomycetes bacterium]|nr:TolC family protein [Planctomycetota bacterium]
MAIRRVHFGTRAGACAALTLAAALTLRAQPPDPPFAAPGAPLPGARQTAYPIDLTTALRLADANNPTVGVARARVREAVAQFDRSRVAWVPTLSMGPTFFYHQGIDQNRRGDVFTVSRGNYTLGIGPTLRVDLSDALYLPLVARQGVRGANALARATANGIQLDVALAYLDLAEVHALLVINADVLDRTEQILKAAEAGAKSGINKTAADVNRAATEVQVRREETTVLRGRAAAASARLARLLVLDPTVELLPYETAIVPLVLVPGESTLEQLVQTGLRARPEVAAARAGVAAANALVRQAKMAPLLPRAQGEFIGGGLSGGRGSDFSPLQSQYNAGAALVWNLEGFGLGNAAAVRGRQAGYDAAVYRLQETEALVASQVVEAAQTSAARYVALEPAQGAVRQALEMYRKFRDVSFAMLGPKGQLQFDALEPLTAVQALNQARVLYLQQVVEFNRSQFRLYAALGQPALCGVDAAAPQPLAVPVVPAKPAALSVPAPRPVP